MQKIRAAGIPLFTVDTASPSSNNDTTSDNFYIGEQLAVQLANDIHGEGNILVFNGFYGISKALVAISLICAGFSASWSAPKNALSHTLIPVGLN